MIEKPYCNICGATELGFNHMEKHAPVSEIGPWQGPTKEEWVARIAEKSLRKDEQLPFIKKMKIGKDI